MFHSQVFRGGVDQPTVDIIQQLSPFIQALNHSIANHTSFLHFSAQVCVQAQALEIQQLHAHLHSCICQYSSLLHHYSILQDECTWKDETNRLLLDDLMNLKDELQRMKVDCSSVGVGTENATQDIDTQTTDVFYHTLQEEKRVLEEKYKELNMVLHDCQLHCDDLKKELDVSNATLEGTESDLKILEEELKNMQSDLLRTEVELGREKKFRRLLRMRYERLKDGCDDDSDEEYVSTSLSQGSDSLHLELPSTPTNNTEFSWLLSPAPSLDT